VAYTSWVTVTVVVTTEHELFESTLVTPIGMAATLELVVIEVEFKGLVAFMGIEVTPNGIDVEFNVVDVEPEVLVVTLAAAEVPLTEVKEAVAPAAAALVTIWPAT